jgi:hypothetical protein
LISEANFASRGFHFLGGHCLGMPVETFLMKTDITAAGGYSAYVAAPVRLCFRPAFVFRFAFSGVAGLMWLRIPTRTVFTQKVARQSPCSPELPPRRSG